MEGITSHPAHTIASGSFITPLMISAVGVISSSIGIIVYHYILVKYCARGQQPSTTTNNSLSQPVQESPSTGVDKKILETIPIISYSKQNDHLFRVDQTECVVCLGDLEHGEIVRLLPSCKHAFHVPCIDQWFVAHNSCPICRSPLVAPVSIDPVAPPLPPCIEETTRRALEDQSPPHDHQEQEHEIDENSASSSGQQSCSMLRHCASLVLPVDQRQSRRRLITGLKRSLSLDQSSVIIDIQSETASQDCSSSSPPVDDSLTRKLLYRARSVKYSDCVSAKLLMSSIPRFRMGRNNEVLPY